MIDFNPQMSATQHIAVDAHVHLRSVDRQDLLIAAANLARAGGTVNGGMLLMTESHGCDVFAQLVRSGLTPTKEKQSLLVENDGFRLAIVAGRQVITAERVEVLLLGLREAPRDGLPLAELLRRTTCEDAIIVLPWGLGKWTGMRRRLVRETLVQHHGRVLIGDIQTRPRLWRDDILVGAGSTGIATLSGTDPLPLPGESTRIGKFGQMITMGMDWHRPAASLFAALVDASTPIIPFGQPLSLAHVVALQLGLRLPWRQRDAA